MSLNVNEIRKDFEILANLVNGKPLIYLDSAATALKPKVMLDSLEKYYKHASANVHRGVYFISNEATQMYENARITAAKFVNAKSENEIIFTKGATSALNLVAMGYGLHNLKEGDEILTTELEHHSSFLPWQNIAKVTKATLKFIPLTQEGRVTVENVKSVLTENTAVVAINHVSNVMGYISPIQEISSLAHSVGAIVVVDASQSAPHMKLDVEKLGCDFLALTGHKIFGPTGIGVLYGRKHLLNLMQPVEFGGEMIDVVDVINGSTFKDAPYRFEAGTPPIAEAIGLAAGMDYISKLGWENLHDHEMDLRNYAISEFEKLQGVTIFNKTAETAIISFNVDGVHPHDMATIYDEYGVCVRAGQHCAQPLMKFLCQSSTLRASFTIYNTKEDVDALIQATIVGKETFTNVF